MRFELFDGPRSLGTVAWDRAGVVRLRIRDPETLTELLEHFGGGAGLGDSNGNADIPREDWSPAEFEQSVLGLRATHGFTVVPRPTGPDHRGGRRAH